LSLNGQPFLEIWMTEEKMNASEKLYAIYMPFEF
jgi:hypothetical protein